ncbi:protein MOR1-like [Humulus lupulus]|uniref:protein MOR1-like n=1 Tax=Humulus lupulus TaxID=3486 RepID=UPI002B411966|nr:protein MOR1-like [Humulus lupulus]
MLSIADIKTAVKNKVPLVRSSTLNWVTFCIETSNKVVILKVHKDYVPILMECLNDGTPDVRDAAFSALAAIAKLVGMRPLERSLEKLDDVRRKKLSETKQKQSILDGDFTGWWITYGYLEVVFAFFFLDAFTSWFLL